MFYNELAINPEEHPILWIDPVLGPKAIREKQCQIMAETFNVPAMFAVIDSVASMLSTGRLDGLVVNVGTSTSVMPIMEGYSAPHACILDPIGGNTSVDHLITRVKEKGVDYGAFGNQFVCKDIVEKYCYVAEDYPAELQKCERKMYCLPDGKIIDLGIERISSTETLFNGPLGLHNMIHQSIRKCDVELQDGLANNIVLVGGHSMLPGLVDRLRKELNHLGTAQKINIVAQPDRKYMPWLGGSLIASLSSFQEHWISKEEYDESGPSIIHRRYF